ncbi:MAG: hypothetical protein JWQ21_2094 [Herminiimonas sp.]|nr:hypothetical protein [Herminiimonas sp.]
MGRPQYSAHRTGISRRAAEPDPGMHAGPPQDTGHAGDLPHTPATRPTLRFGDEAFACLGSDDFLRKWQRLQEQCPWATAFQDQDFVVPWYGIYRDDYLPILVFEESGGELAALLTLALRRGSRRIAAAGDVQAEYQCWLETPGTDSLFVRRALQILEKTIPGMHLSLRYLPPGTPSDWKAAAPGGATLLRLVSHVLPLMEVNSECAASPSANRKVDIKRRTRKLEKYGEVQFAQVTDAEQFAGMFDEICDQYDFRQAAAYNVMPFSADPRKKVFHLELHRRGKLFTSVLKVGDRIAASDCGMLTGRKILHNCFNAHLPALSACSPGILHLALLEAHLAREGIPVFDLTPGPSRHKEFFATSHAMVFEFNAYHGIFAYLKHEIPARMKRLLKRAMGKAGVTPRSLRLGLAAMLRPVRAAGLRVPAERLYLCRQSPSPDRNGELSVSKDNLSDLLRFDPGWSPVARQDFLAAAMALFERLRHVYTGVSDGRLLYSCWVEKLASDAGHTSPPGIECFSKSSVALFDLREHEQRGDPDRLRAFLAAVLADVMSVAGAKSVYLTGRFDKRTRRAIEQCGFLEETGRRDLPMSIAG